LAYAGKDLPLYYFPELYLSGILLYLVFSPIQIVILKDSIRVMAQNRQQMPSVALIQM
jgi:hypothetical protein